VDDKCKISAIQAILGVTTDGVWGPKTQAALDAVIGEGAPDSSGVKHATYASSFADPADVEAFNKCKAQGKSDDECFKVGDNGIGCWNQSTIEGTGPSCALPPEYMEARWGTVAAAKNKPVTVVNQQGEKVKCILKDRMPHVDNLANQARIDLNPDACEALGFTPPVMEQVTWWWS
jgi:hypothetical protein